MRHPLFQASAEQNQFEQLRVIDGTKNGDFGTNG